jgi:hypothetical protein
MHLLYAVSSNAQKLHKLSSTFTLRDATFCLFFRLHISWNQGTNRRLGSGCSAVANFNDMPFQGWEYAELDVPGHFIAGPVWDEVCFKGFNNDIHDTL